MHLLSVRARRWRTVESSGGACYGRSSMTWIDTWLVAVIAVVALALGVGHATAGRLAACSTGALYQESLAGGPTQARSEVVPALASRSEGSYVGYFPNPAREKVTFITRGICWCQVHAMRVQIYDEAGALVLSTEAESQILELDLGGSGSSFLCDGVYLVHSELLIRGVWMAAGVGKLAIIH